MPRFLVFAYACEPGTGSEPGAGWIWSRMIARLGETWVITRTNNRPLIEQHLRSIPERRRLRFVYVDLPEWARFWKRGMRGARLYYFLWQAAAVREARRIRSDVPFDAVWHLTWANAWLGSVAALLREPFIYGPVGGGVSMPWRLAPAVGARGAAFEIMRAVARNVARFGNPLARLSWWRARLVLVQNPETKAWLPKRHGGKTLVFHHVVLDKQSRVATRSPRRPPFTALFAGRLLPWKGVSLALHTLALLPDWRLVVCGRGPDGSRLKRLAREMQIDDRVEFRGWVPREELDAWMRRSDAFLFPSLHDEGGWVVAEALAEGMPVVCLDHGGPPVVGGFPVPVTSARATARKLAAAISSADSRIGSFPTLSARTEELRRILSTWFPSWDLSISLHEEIVLEPPEGRR